nr:CDC27 family protein [Candidatus Campylobacter infans]
MDTLKENFYKTHDIQYVRLLAKEYYDKKDYKNAAKWALTLNDMDKNDPDGWIIFAKSQAKMNKRQDAIRVLETFQNKAPDNQEIQAIISQIYSNTLP